jgi:hypothetical protein
MVKFDHLKSLLQGICPILIRSVGDVFIAAFGIYRRFFRRFSGLSPLYRRFIAIFQFYRRFIATF